MIHRFAAACVVASVLVATGALFTLLLPVPPDLARLLPTAWCFVPAVWGLWALLAPPRWVPHRFPAWGAILGVGASIIAGPLLRLPERFGAPDGARWLAPAIGPILYYALWLIVRMAYRALCVTGTSDSLAAARKTVA